MPALSTSSPSANITPHVFHLPEPYNRLPFSVQSVSAPSGAPLSILRFPEIDSTSSLLQKYSSSPDGLIVQGLVQTSGRGRRGPRKWENAGSQLMFSFAYRHQLAYPQILSLVVGSAVHRTISSMTPEKISIKWPNDLLKNGRKICGILCENRMSKEQSRAIIGIGINMKGSPDSLPEELRTKAGFLFEDSARITFADEQIIAGIYQNFMELAASAAGGFEKIVNEWKSHCSSFGSQVKFTEGEKSSAGTLVDINEKGHLMIRTETGIVNLLGGEIDFI